LSEFYLGFFSFPQDTSQEDSAFPILIVYVPTVREGFKPVPLAFFLRCAGTKVFLLPRQVLSDEFPWRIQISTCGRFFCDALKLLRLHGL